MTKQLLFLSLLLSRPLWCQTQVETTGLLIGLKDGQWVVQGVLPGSSAEAAQIRPGDIILAFKGAKGGRYFEINSERMGPGASEFSRPGSHPVGLRLQRGSRTLEVEVTRGSVGLTAEGLRGFPEGRVTGRERTFTTIDFPGGGLAYGDKLAVVQGQDVLGMAEVRDSKGSSYSVSLTGIRRNQPPISGPGPGGLPQSAPDDSLGGLRGARVVLLEHGDRYYEGASGGRTASGRLDKPYIQLTPALEPYERQVKQGTLKVQSATLRDFNPAQKTFLLRWQQGQMRTTGISGSQIGTSSTFSSGDPLYELTVLYQGAPVWYSADEADQGKDASSRLRDGQAVKVYYRPFGVPGTGSHKGRKTSTSQGQAVLILLDKSF